jgi:AraC-like DNA-binding protein
MRIHFSTDELPPRDRAQFWRDLVATHVLKATPSKPSDPETFWGKVDVHITERFRLFTYEDSSLSGSRTAADIRNDNAQRFHLHRVPREQIYTSMPTRRTALEIHQLPGDFYITSSEWPFHGTMKGWVSVSGLVIPPGVLSPLLAGGRLTRLVPVPAGSPLGSLLGAAFDAAVTQVPLLSPELGEAVLQNLCGLVALACGASEEGRWSGRESLRGARLEAAKRYIDQHLAEPDLTPASAAAALGISLRHLHLLFEVTGTSFAQYVTERRLLQCHDTLTSPNGAGRSVADIAFGWGFNSLATFYRAFDRKFGLPPASLRHGGAGRISPA